MSAGNIIAIDGGWAHPQPGAREIVNVVTVIVLPILLSLCLAITIYYAVHPVQPMIQITADVFLSLPVVVCGSIGLAIAFVLCVQLCRHRQVANAFGSTNSGLIRRFVHQGRRDENQTIEQYEEVHQAGIEDFEEFTDSVSVTFDTRDGVKLSGFWHEASPNHATVILFHCTGGISAPTKGMASIYQKCNCNVLTLEYRGYGRSGGNAGGPNQEIDAYLDAEAALKFVLSKGVPLKNVYAHGYSLGGAYAASLGYFYGVRNIILDHTFTSLSDLCASKFSPLPWHKLMSGAFGKLKYPKDPDIPTAQELVTDGFDTAAKLQKMGDINVCVICGTDDMMTPPKMAEDLVEARYPNNPAQQQKSLVVMDGAHNDGLRLLLPENRAAFEQFWNFIVDNY